jgi:hypothetical protein
MQARQHPRRSNVLRSAVGRAPTVDACITAGTYSGIVEKLGYLKRLGVNAIELLPVHEFNELEYYAVRTCETQLLRNSSHDCCFQGDDCSAN